MRTHLQAMTANEEWQYGGDDGQSVLLINTYRICLSLSICSLAAHVLFSKIYQAV